MVSKRMAETLKGYDANTQRKILRFVEIAGEDYALEHLPVVFKQAREKELELDRLQVTYKENALDEVYKYLANSSKYADWIYDFLSKHPTSSEAKYPPQKKLPADKPSGSSGAGNTHMDGIYKQIAADYSQMDPSKVWFYQSLDKPTGYPWDQPAPKPPAKTKIPSEAPSGSDSGDAVLEFLKSFLRR